AKAQGMYVTQAVCWNYDDASRACARKFFEKTKKMPTASQAGVYSATLPPFSWITSVASFSSEWPKV
ncbi:MAG: hypothetical protein NTT76_07330, partial [Achromobacter xylosoxidans]|nr:hypothetical protein [Achromobacter xylosoxidans]